MNQESLISEIAAQGVRDPSVLAAFSKVDRKGFIPFESRALAYIDEPIAIPHGQVTSQPSLIAGMLEALTLRGHEAVLEIGTGLGFQTALLATLCRQVHSIERFAELSRLAKDNLAAAGITNAILHVGDGTLGLRAHAPFDAIVLSAAAPEVPDPLIAQLNDGGRLVQPIGPGGNEIVILFQKFEGMLLERERLTRAHFVPLVGIHGVKSRSA